MSFIARTPFALAAALAATVTVAAATPAFAAPAKPGTAAGLVLVSIKSGGVTGPRRYCIANAGEPRTIACRTEREWAKRRILLRLV